MESKYISGSDYEVNVRGGLVVSMSDIHKEILSIMDRVDSICRKYDITYGLLGGSALGAVNYGGFIPWDDDIDIFVARRDWDKFILALEKELGDEFYFQCYEKDKRYNVLIPQMKIRKKNTYVEEVNVLLDNRCSGNGIFVDVVSYGDISDKKWLDFLFRTFIKLLMVPMIVFDNLGINPRIFKWLAVKVENFYNRISSGSDLVSQPILIPWEKFMREPVFKKEDVFPVKEYDFEGRKYFSYNNIEKVLKSWYGNNCLKKWDKKKRVWKETLPVEKRVPKHIKDLSVDSDVSSYYFQKKRLNICLKINFWSFLLGSVFLFFGKIWLGVIFLGVVFFSLIGIIKYNK